MNIKNMQLSSVEARRYSRSQQPVRNVRIDHNSTVTLFTPTGKQEAQVEFEYTASYGPLGLVKLSGEFIYESSDAREVAERWSESKNMPNEVASRIHTAIMHFCLPEAVMISRDLRLPPPIPMPQVQFDQPQEGGKGTGGWSPEVA
ncbi:MAG: hypothetical protein PHZ19_09000 [Candidatus Thermoplasmatota archaeon]|nr:hypothetical protein [Candidatus Thermoplasmatota archaeon]